MNYLQKIAETEKYIFIRYKYGDSGIFLLDYVASSNIISFQMTVASNLMCVRDESGTAYDENILR